MPMVTNISMRGDLVLQSRLTQWAKRAGNTIPAMKAIEVLLEDKERELFESQGNTGRHGEWQGLADITVEDKVSKALYPEILRATDALFDSLTDSSNENAIREIGPGFLRFGTKLGYAAIQASGFTSRGGNSVPARRPIDWTLVDRSEVVSIINAWITGIETAGRRFRVSIVPSMRTFK